MKFYPEEYVEHFLQIVFKHLKVFYFLTARSWKLPSEEVVHENGRVRRRATWEDDDIDDDDNVDDGNDDGEEDDYGDDDAGDSDDEDRDDQNSDIEESDKTRNEKIKLNKTTVS